MLFLFVFNTSYSVTSQVTRDKHLQHECDLFYNFINFKKTFDKSLACRPVEGPQHGFNREEGLVQAIQTCENFSRAVLLNNQLGEFFKTTISVHQGCLLSQICFNLFLDMVMQETLHDHHISISIGGRPTCNLLMRSIS